MQLSKLFVVSLVGLVPAFGGVAVAQTGGKVTRYIDSLPMQTVDAGERADLLMMREEEKLARDVYRVLYDVWKIPAFANIAASEQSHMDLTKYVLDRYKIPDPVVSDKTGEFRAPLFKHLFHVLVVFGVQSRNHALVVGGFIEDLDIFDLDAALVRSDNRDIDTLWQNLQLGSRNHMRSFYKLLLQNNIVYPGIVLPAARIQSIVNSPMEPGAVDENGKAL